MQKACEKVMKDKEFCSVWKEIVHEDGPQAPEITNAVKKLLEARAITGEIRYVTEEGK